VFVIRKKKADFVPVETGISGTTDIEITKGLQEGDEVITGSYKVLRTLKPGTSVKIDNSAPKKEDERPHTTGRRLTSARLERPIRTAT
jgi:HlyD family secretion protein